MEAKSYISACSEMGFPAYRVGAYYYPWYGDDFHGGAYLREHLVPVQLPELGEYDDRDPEVIKQHLTWSRQAGIGFWAASWWGPGGREDITLLEHVLVHPDLGDFQISLIYETSGRTENFTDYSNLAADIDYLVDNYFEHPNYLKIEGKAVLFVYLTRVLESRGSLVSSLEMMRSAAREKGVELFIIGDHAFGPPPGLPGNLSLMDAVTNYDVYGAMGASGYAGQPAVEAYATAQQGWKEQAVVAGIGFVPSVTPGFNDTGVRSGHLPLSRKLTEDASFGSLFRALLAKAREQVDERVGCMLMVTSFNEWHEDTQIEPVRKADATTREEAFTGGLPYEGYGEKYLQILREELGP